MSRTQRRFGEDIACSGCGVINMRRRYKCLRCLDFDLCGDCYDSNDPAFLELPPHNSFHSFQRILTPEEQSIYFGSSNAGVDTWESFACPCCPSLGFTTLDLRSHLFDEHRYTTGECICPICAAKDGLNISCGDILSHITEHCHRNAVSTGRRADSPRPLRNDTVSIPSPADASAMNRMRHSAVTYQRNVGFRVDANAFTIFPRDGDSVAAGLLADLEFGASTILTPPPNVRWPGDGNAELVESPAEDDCRSSVCSEGASSTAFSSVDGEIAERSRATSLPTVGVFSVLDDSRSLLATLLKQKLTDDQKRAIDVERANRSLFVQELLMSTFAETEETRSTWTQTLDASVVNGAAQSSEVSRQQAKGSTGDGCTKSKCCQTQPDLGNLAQDTVVEDAGASGDAAAQRGTVRNGYTGCGSDAE